MATYEEIQKVNEQIKMIDVKGNPYASVAERIKAFRMLYPMGFIKSDLVSNQDGVCIIKAEVGVDDKVLGVGYAYEKENSSFINKTSYIENCQTSAVGRALGMCGLGIDSDVASAEETQNAQLQQEGEKPITAEQKKALIKSLEEEQIPAEYICELYGVSEIKEMNQKKYSNLIGNWEKLKKKYHERKNS